MKTALLGLLCLYDLCTSTFFLAKLQFKVLNGLSGDFLHKYQRGNKFER